MGVLWEEVDPSATSPGGEAPGGAVPCAIGNRVYLVGGSATSTTDTDIALGVCTWSSPACLEEPPGGGGQPSDSNSTAADSGGVASSTTITSIVYTGAPQEGDVPSARIGHAAVVHPSRSAIVLFGGESASAPAGGASSTKLPGVYEGSPKEPSGKLVWRALIDPASDENTNTGEVASAHDAPTPLAFHAACVASVRDEWAMIVHGGINRNSSLSGDLWAFHFRNEGKAHDQDKVGGDKAGFSWERLLPDGQGPPPAAYHSATPINDGKKVVFLGGKEWGSSVFLLDAVGVTWSSVEVAGLRARVMHTAVVVTAVEARSPTEDRTGSIIPSPEPEAPLQDDQAAPVAQLWEPVPAIAPGRPTPTGGTSDARAFGGTDSGEGNGVARPGTPVFEGILIFGGISDGSVIGDATVLRVDGSVGPLPLGRRLSPSPDSRYNHAMLPVQGGRQVLLFGGCRGDGTRLVNAFVLDLANPAGGAGGVDEGEDGDGVDQEATETDKVVSFDNGDVYTGKLDADGRRHGDGRCEFAARAAGGGGCYSGEWGADQPHGRGERIYSTGRGETSDTDTAFGPGFPPLASYTGDWNRGARDGRGTCTFVVPTPNGGAQMSGLTGCSTAGGGAKGIVPTVPDSYEGNWVDGRPFGGGTLRLRGTGGSLALTTAGGSSIEGVWTEEGLIHGKEKLLGKGGVYEGQYRLGKREGHGRLDLQDGSEYEGAWKNGRQNGSGTFRCGVTRQVYTGKWVGGVRCGRGACEYTSGSRYEGLWLDGKKHGEGVLKFPNCDLQAGTWHRDEYVEPAAATDSVCETSTLSLTYRVC